MATVSLRTRIDKLTRRYGDARPCVGCGASPNGPVQIVFGDDEDTDRGTDTGGTYCPGCGWPVAMTFTIARPEPEDVGNE